MQPPPYGSGYPPNNQYPPQGSQYPPQAQGYPPQGSAGQYPPPPYNQYPPQGGNPPPSYYPPGNQQQPPYQGAPYSHGPPSYQPSGYPQSNQYPPPPGQGAPPAGQYYPPPSDNPSSNYPYGPPSGQQGAYPQPSYPQAPSYPQSYYPPPGSGGNPQYPPYYQYPPSSSLPPSAPPLPASSSGGLPASDSGALPGSGSNALPGSASTGLPGTTSSGPLGSASSGISGSASGALQGPDGYHPPHPSIPEYPRAPTAPHAPPLTHPPAVGAYPSGPAPSQTMAGYPSLPGAPPPSMPAYPPPVNSPPPGGVSFSSAPTVGPMDPAALAYVGATPPPQMFPAGPHGHHLTAENFPKVIGVPSEDGCGALHVPDMMGPMLRYNTMDANTGHWLGSVLFVIRSPTPKPPQPSLSVTILEHRRPIMAPYVVPAEHLYTFHSWYFWRFPLAIPMGQGDTERNIQYGLEGGRESWDFWIPGQGQSWHWSYYSCAGYSSSLEASRKVHFDDLLMELMRRHDERPHHLCFGGGDQLYNDMVFRLRTISEWQARPRDLRERDPFTPAMEAEAEAYYFAHYMTHYSHRWMSQLVSRIPQMMMWDDHDIFDGYGSYPPSLNNCEVFQRLYMVARCFYLLFQQHTTDGLAERHGFIKTAASPLSTSPALNQLAVLGPRVALLAVDMRSERTKTQILPSGGWRRLSEELRKLPPTVKHVVVGSGVPVVYPSLGEVEALLESISEANRNPTNTPTIGGAIQNVLGGAMNMVFDEPELLDDLNDHWNAKGHMREKEEMVKMFQDLAATRGMRISFLSGDVHLCATGRLRTVGKDKKETDPNYMLQVVSSAIVNDPPPDGLVTFMSQKALMSTILFGQTEERMRATFGGGFLNMANVKSKLLNRRNFCLIQECADQSLMFTIVVEMPNNKYKLYPSTVPPIQYDPAAHIAGLSFQSHRASTMDSRAGDELHKQGSGGRQGPGRSSTFAGY